MVNINTTGIPQRCLPVSSSVQRRSINGIFKVETQPTGPLALASFSRSHIKKRLEAKLDNAEELGLKEGSYSYKAIQRRFNDLDLDHKGNFLLKKKEKKKTKILPFFGFLSLEFCTGTISESDLKNALIKLELPTSEDSIQSFIRDVTGKTFRKVSNLFPWANLSSSFQFAFRRAFWAAV